jgi:hypothetical protein
MRARQTPMTSPAIRPVYSAGRAYQSSPTTLLRNAGALRSETIALVAPYTSIDAPQRLCSRGYERQAFFRCSCPRQVAQGVMPLFALASAGMSFARKKCHETGRASRLELSSTKVRTALR